eukprot:43758-Prorocentrum_minimum.AAC.1
MRGVDNILRGVDNIVRGVECLASVGEVLALGGEFFASVGEFFVCAGGHCLYAEFQKEVRGCGCLSGYQQRPHSSSCAWHVWAHPVPWPPK